MALGKAAANAVGVPAAEGLGMAAATIIGGVSRVQLLRLVSCGLANGPHPRTKRRSPSKPPSVIVESGDLPGNPISTSAADDFPAGED
jgi:hypothetical protein